MRGRRPVARPQGDAGMVSAELAAAVPAVLLTLVVGVTAVRLGVDEVRCVDAARLAARALARGDSEAAAVALAARAAPAGSAVTVSGVGAEVRVQVTAGGDLVGWGTVTMHGEATAPREAMAGSGTSAASGAAGSPGGSQ